MGDYAWVCGKKMGKRFFIKVKAILAKATVQTCSKIQEGTTKL